MKINSARSTRHRKNSKQTGIEAIDSCSALFGARQYGATTRESSDEKYPRTLILSPDPELSTPTESRHTTCLLGGKSPSVKLMSRRENKNVGQNQPNKHGQNHARIAAYRIYKRSTAQKFIKLQTLTTRDCKRTANEYAEERRISKDLISRVYIISFADQVFIDPTFFGIFVAVLCSPLWLMFVISS